MISYLFECEYVDEHVCLWSYWWFYFHHVCLWSYWWFYFHHGCLWSYWWFYFHRVFNINTHRLYIHVVLLFHLQNPEGIVGSQYFRHGPKMYVQRQAMRFKVRTNRPFAHLYSIISRILHPPPPPPHYFEYIREHGCYNFLQHLVYVR